MSSSVWVLVLGGVFFIGTIVLQVYLSKKEAKAPGLVLPIISFVISIFVTVEVILAGVMYEGRATEVQEVVISNEEAVVSNEEGVGGNGVPGTGSNDDTTYMIDDSSSFSSGELGEADSTTSFYPATEEKSGSNSMVRFLLMGITTFFLYNISTLVYTGVYIFCRKRKNTADGGKNSAVDKMKIQDL